VVRECSDLQEVGQGTPLGEGWIQRTRCLELNVQSIVGIAVERIAVDIFGEGME
jgi:hypothetical protein